MSEFDGVIAIDAMGRDFGPSVTVPAAITAMKDYGIKVILVGEEKEMIYAKPIIDSKTERRNNVFIKIRVEYCDKSNKKLGESISTILITLDGE